MNFIKKICISSILLVSFIFAPGLAFGATVKHTFSLDETTEARSIFIATIPGRHQFRTHSNFNSMESSGVNSYEHVNPDDSEAINIVLMHNKKMTPEKYCRRFKQQVSIYSKDIKIVEELYFSIPRTAVNAVKLVLTHTDRKRQENELIYLEFHSGSKTCACFQYSITLSDVLTEEAALEKARAFARRNVKIILRKINNPEQFKE
jgi:hypothetical protein